MTKIAIYTANVGNYDTLRQPYVPEEYRANFDFICFSNDIDRSHLGVWEIKKFNIQLDDNTRVARYIKLHPHVLLENYSYTIWVDSNIEIIGNSLYKIGIEMVRKNILVSGLKHYKLDCAYTDGYFCVRYNKDSFEKINKHINFLRSKGYPKNNGLFETGVFFRNNYNETVKTLNDEWWKLMCVFSKRDQLSINYLLWKNKLDLIYFLGESDIRQHPDFVLHKHQSGLFISFVSFLRFKFSNRLNRIKGRFLSFLLRGFLAK